jgi:hypothetical protein
MTHRLIPILALGALLCTRPLQGQGKIGFTAGVVSANLAYTGSTHDTKGLVGFAGGLTMSWRIGNNLSFNPEALYVQKGAQSNTTGDDTKVKIAYIEVPVLFRYTFGTENKGVGPYITAGPAVSIKASCKVSETVSGVSASADCDATGTKLKSTDIGGVIGAGFQSERFGVMARYEASLTDINDTPGSPTKVHNNTWSLMASFRP